MRKTHLGLALGLCVLPALWAAACGGDSEGGTSSNTGGSVSGGSGGGDAGSDVSSGGSGGLIVSDGSTCPQGQPCDGGICAGNVCCAADKACSASCCGGADVCSFGKCVTPGATCTDSADCAPSEYCEYSLGTPGEAGAPDSGADGGTCIGGATFQQGKCLPTPPICATGADAGASDGGSIDCLPLCEVKPTTTTFAPQQKYAWGGQITAPTASDVMMTPIVVQLDDDDCDGKITERDIPEILFTSFASGGYVATGTLHAISIVAKQVVDKWSVTGISASRQLAGGNIDGKPGNEVVACPVDGNTVRAYDGAGKQLWSTSGLLCNQPAIADLDQDGVPEVIVEGGILDGATGALKKSFSPAMIGTFAVADVTGDGKLDIVAATQVFDANGAQIATNGGPAHAWTGGTHFKSGPAVADLDKDGKPEIIGVYFLQHQLTVWQYDTTQANNAKIIRAGVDINGTLNPALCNPGSAGSQWGGGPATVGDFNGDTFPDVALAGGVGYAVFDGKKLMDTTVAGPSTFLWTKQTVDCSSAGTGSSLFDFNGDGKAEVVYADEYTLHIYEGATGNVLFETCNTSGTLSEYPLVADVDNDGEADIVVGSNAYSSISCPGGQKTSGIRVFGSTGGDWVRTRRVWNQHAYAITGTQEDGTIPAKEPANWTVPGLNNFRLNRQPGSEFAAVDAVVDLKPVCTGAYALVATVRNLGQALLPAGMKVEFFSGNPPSGTKLGEATTSVALGPAQAEQVVLQLPSAPADVKSGATPVYATVTVPLPTRECRDDNNTSAAVSGKCVAPR
ncbi:MAG: VCBS repeat-containing protein [Myxococcales bacterium]|nr:VCBS repeat-containing protein [Myxococcales bacterium]